MVVVGIFGETVVGRGLLFGEQGRRRCGRRKVRHVGFLVCRGRGDGVGSKELVVRRCGGS